jgi:hypothetical protein
MLNLNRNPHPSFPSQDDVIVYQAQQVTALAHALAHKDQQLQQLAAEVQGLTMQANAAAEDAERRIAELRAVAPVPNGLRMACLEAIATLESHSVVPAPKQALLEVAAELRKTLTEATGGELPSRVDAP